MDVLTRLSDEHEALRAHLERIQIAAEARDDQALIEALRAAREVLTSELDAHIALEEGAFHDVVEALGVGLFAPFHEEHIEIRRVRDGVITALENGAAPHTTALWLCELILGHQQREDLMLFPSAREVMSSR